MTNASENDPRKNFVPRVLPWILAVVALAVYCVTLNPWVSLLNLDPVAKISGWRWQPEVYQPLLFLVTYPFRWLPTAMVPVALNVFSAVCAAVTLGLLARSVALLPHDRTDAQRKREHSAFGFLTMPLAWVPPVLAVAVCGLQLTFWQQATNFTGEVFELLLFAFVVWLLLEYRIDEREGRLFLAAAVVGAAMPDNFAVLGFLPFFLAAVIWIRGFSFFNPHFLVRLILFGFIGTLFYFLLPLLTYATFPIGFWEALKPNFAAQWQVVKLFFTVDGVRHALGLMSLTSLIPVLVMSIRWRSTFGDSSQIGTMLAGFMFHIVHGLIFVACLWAAFDPPLSPRHQAYGMPGLPFYFLGALSVGYYGGYLLLVNSVRFVSRRRTQKLRTSPLLRFSKVVLVVAVCALGAAEIAGLCYKNFPIVRDANGPVLKNYAQLLVKNLPATGGIIMGDSESLQQDVPVRLFLAEAALAREGKLDKFVPLDTSSLLWPEYHRYLHRHHPRVWPLVVGKKDMRGLNPMGMVGMINMLSRSNDVYYLQPSFGYYFENFYQEPRGLVYKLKVLPSETLLPPLPDKDLVAENDAFWASAKTGALVPVEKRFAGRTDVIPSFRANFLAHLHVNDETNPAIDLVGGYYSQAENFWGVQLQRANQLPAAASCFEEALKLNPDNVVAKINLDFNHTLSAGKTAPIDLEKTTADQFGKYHDWGELLKYNGPLDEPSFCFKNGVVLVQNACYRQAIDSFNRVHQLAPENLPARLWLGQLYLLSRLPDRALDAMRDAIDHPEKYGVAQTNTTELNVLAAAVYFQKNDVQKGVDLLQTEIARHPDDNVLLTAAVQAYIARGLYTNALEIIDQRLKAAPGDTAWLFGKGFVEMQLKNYDAAAGIFSKVLAIQTNNPDALFNRAVSYLQSDNLDAARADYLQLGKTYTNSFQVAFGLGEIAWRKHETNDAIRYYQIYMATANTNTTEARTIAERLRDMKK